MPLTSTPSTQVLDIYKILSFVKLNTNNVKVSHIRQTVFVTPDNLSNSMGVFENLYNLITNVYPNNTYVKKITETSATININKYNAIKVEISNQKAKLPQVLKPGESYELYFKSVILDGLSELNSLKEELELPDSIFNLYHNLTLNLYDGDGKKASIGPITKVEKVGQALGKADIEIYVRNLPKVKISLKQENFSFWSSASTYSPRPINILNSAISSGKIILKKNSAGLNYFDNGVTGIRVPATLEEVKKFCFGGESGVNYIVINGGNVRKENRSTDNKMILQITAKKIYRNNNQSELTRLQPDVFLIIKSNPDGRTSSGLFPYRGLSIHFANRNHAYSPKYKYVDG